MKYNKLRDFIKSLSVSVSILHNTEPRQLGNYTAQNKLGRNFLADPLISEPRITGRTQNLLRVRAPVRRQHKFTLHSSRAGKYIKSTRKCLNNPKRPWDSSLAVISGNEISCGNGQIFLSHVIGGCEKEENK